MDYSERKLMKDDCLGIPKMLCSDIYHLKPIRLLLFVCFLIHLTISLIQLYFFIYIMTITEFIQYGPQFACVLYPLLSMPHLLFKNDLIDHIQGEFILWTIDSAGEDLHRRFRKQIRIITIFFVFSITIGQMGSWTLMRADANILFPIKFFNDYFPEYAARLSSIYRFNFVLVGMVSMAHCLQFIYYTQHIKFQIMMLLKYTSRVGDGLSEHEDYQELVKARLRFCAIRHAHLISAGRRKSQQISSLVIMFSTAGCVMLFSLLLHVYTSAFYSDLNYGRIVALALSMCSTFAAVMMAGQAIETESSLGLRLLQEVPWYNFNESNKKTFLLIMLNLMDPFRLKLSENVSVNHELGLTILKGVYSMISILTKMKDVMSERI